MNQSKVLENHAKILIFEILLLNKLSAVNKGYSILDWDVRR